MEGWMAAPCGCPQYETVHQGWVSEAHHCFEEVDLGEGERGAQGLSHFVWHLVDHCNVPLAVQLHRKDPFYSKYL